MPITHISKEEFLAVHVRAPHETSAEVTALLALAPDEGLRMPCRWNHYRKTQCRGGMLLHHAAKRHGFKVNTACKRGILYVWRLP
jgi:hypothetical protein